VPKPLQSEHGWSSIRQGLCSRRGTGWESAFLASLTSSGSHGGSLGVLKANAVGLYVMGSTTKKQRIIKMKRVERNNEQQSNPNLQYASSNAYSRKDCCQMCVQMLMLL